MEVVVVVELNNETPGTEAPKTLTRRSKWFGAWGVVWFRFQGSGCRAWVLVVGSRATMGVVLLQSCL